MNRNTNEMCVSERKCIEMGMSNSRKVRKPLMEKKRRARINQSLNDLKDILLDSGSVKKEGSRPNKLEKADVLELTVNYVNKLHQERGGISRTSSNDNRCSECSNVQSHGYTEESAKFKAGFSECARLVRQLLAQQSPSTLQVNVTERVVRHLEDCLTNIGQDCQISHRFLSTPTSHSSDSCSSFEEKDSIFSGSLDRISSPVDRVTIHSESSSPCDEMEVQQSSIQLKSSSPIRYNTSNSELMTPNTSPINPLHSEMSSRWTIGFTSLPLYASQNFNSNFAPEQFKSHANFIQNTQSHVYASMWRPW